MKMQPRISFSVDSLLGRKTYKKAEEAGKLGITELKKEENEENVEKRVGEWRHPGENQDRRLEDDASCVSHDSSRRLPERGESEEEEEEEEEEDDLNVDDNGEEDEEDDKERLQLHPHHPLHLPLPLPHQALSPTPHQQLLSSLSSPPSLSSPLLRPSSPPSPLLRPPFPPSLPPSSPRLPFVPGFNPAMFDKGTLSYV